MLNRDSPIALHRQLAQRLREAIAGGTYKQGDSIPTEQALMAQHSVSRITARQAVMQLVTEGLLVRRQGKGSFVTAPPVQHQAVRQHQRVLAQQRVRHRAVRRRQHLARQLRRLEQLHDVRLGLDLVEPARTRQPAHHTRVPHRRTGSLDVSYRPKLAISTHRRP